MYFVKERIESKNFLSDILIDSKNNRAFFIEKASNGSYVSCKLIGKVDDKNIIFNEEELGKNKKFENGKYYICME